MFTVVHGGVEYPLGSIQSMRRDHELSAAQELNLITVEDGNFNPAYPYLLQEAIIRSPDGHEYRSKKPKVHDSYKNINAVHVVTDLKGVIFDGTLTGTYTLQQVANAIFAGTGWTVTVNGADLRTMTLKDWGNKNIWTLFTDACKKAAAEFNVLPNKRIVAAATITVDNGKQFRYGYNIRNLAEEVDTTQLATRIIVKYGDKLSQSYTYVSPNEAAIGRIIYADTVTDERIETQVQAIERAKAKLTDVSKLTYTLESADIMVADFREPLTLGETVYTIYEPLNDLNIVTRVMAFREEWNGEEFVITDVSIGNSTFKTVEEELLDAIADAEESAHDKTDETAYVINKNISLRFAETETKILDQYTTITSEYTSAIDINARALTSQFNQQVTTITDGMTAMTADYNSKITQTAQQIRDEVSANVTSINGSLSTIRSDLSSVTQTASSIQTTVNSQTTSINGLNSRLSTAETSITQQADLISQKVSQTDYTGETLFTLMEQTPSSFKFKAPRIDFEGHVFGEGATFSGNISTAQDAYVGERIYLQTRNSGNGAGIVFGTPSLTYGEIFSDYYGTEIRAGTMTVGGDFVNIGNFDTQRVTVSSPILDVSSVGQLIGVVASQTQGLGLAYSPTSNQVKVRIHGSEVGVIQL